MTTKTRTKEEKIEEFEKRLEHNLENITNFQYIVRDKHRLIIDDDGNIIGSRCRSCMAPTDANPYAGCAAGVSVVTYCIPCLEDICEIDDHLHKALVPTINKRGVPPEVIKVDFNIIKEQIKKKEAKLVGLAKRHHISPPDMREMLIKEFGDSIIFKKGRNGGIFFKDTK